jgi:hypothetical protein
MIRTVRGLRLMSKNPGYWVLESDGAVIFMLHGTARLGVPGARYTVQRWSYPGSDATAQSLDAAVARYLAGAAK